MSNLKLPNLHYRALLDSLPASRKPLLLGYATTAERDSGEGRAFDYIHIRHHGSIIATIAPFAIWITHAGYSSKTTAMRIHRVLKDNHVPFGFGIRQRSATLLDENLEPVEGYALGAVVRMNAGVWEYETH